MARYRVKAYFMHEQEEAAARIAESEHVIESAEWTPGYVMGIVDEVAIANLTAKGLIVTPVEKVASAAAPDATSDSPLEIASISGNLRLQGHAPSLGIAPATEAPSERSIPLALSDAKPAKKIESRNRKKPDFYLVRFHGPLTTERLAALRNLGVNPLERITRNKYTIHLQPTQLIPLAKLQFVNWIRVYDEADTLRPSAQAEQAAPSKWKRTAMYAVRLHRPKDMNVVLGWLKSRNVRPLSKGKGVLQIALPANGKELRALAKIPEVAVIEEMRPARLLDHFARGILGLPSLNGSPQSEGLSGEGEIIGIADTGLDETHPDFQGRIVGLVALGRPKDASDPNGHGTHVTGCAAGSGKASNGDVTGAAPKARIYFQSVLDRQGGLGGIPQDLGQLFQQAYGKGVRIHNNSWGAFAFARYSVRSQDVDEFVAAHPDMLIVIAAGNDGIGIPRAAGSSMNAKEGFVDWPCVAAPATAKNGLTVGASRSSRTSGGYAKLKWSDAWRDQYPHPPISQETISGNEECLAAFSSRGPCDDLRIKPDVVAPGTDIAAARSKDAPLRRFWGAYPNNDKYGFMGGTSMAAPYVSGCAALVRQWYTKKAQHAAPSAALMKATLINGTRRIKGADAEAEVRGDPNFHQGFGRIDMATTLPTSNNKLKLKFADTWKKAGSALTATGARARYGIKVGPQAPLRICLAWTDPPARGLQNALVLLVDRGSQEKYIGNSNAASLLRIAGALPDPNNNVQVVRVDAPQAGDYTIAVTASNLLRPPQHFALVVTGDLKSELQLLS